MRSGRWNTLPYPGDHDLTPETKIDAHALRAFIGILGADDVGIYVSAGGFTSEAGKEARSE
ncbi:MAG: restriction endonuclease, partial [Thermoleophilia bacterium]|nr:restriction endonuclease [Thermoleophilia bacterium]